MKRAGDSAPSDPARHLDDHLCVDLILGLLPEPEAERALAHAAQCATCEERLRRWAEEEEHLATRRQLRWQPDGQPALMRPVPPRIRIFAWLREAFRQPRFQLATGLATVCVILLVVLLPSREGLQLVPLSPYRATLELRDVAPADTTHLWLGLTAYEAHRFDEAIARLQTAEASDLDPADEAIRRIFLANALAQSGAYEAVIATLEPVPLALLPPPWGQEARWTLCVALWERGDKERAREILRELAQETGEIAERARTLLR